MALTKCPDCGKKVSSDVTVCPHCGKKLGGTPLHGTPLETVGCIIPLFIIIAIILIFIVWPK